MPIQELSLGRIAVRVLEELKGVNYAALALAGFGCIVSVSVYRHWLKRNGTKGWEKKYRKAKYTAFLLWYLTFIVDVTLLRRIGTSVGGFSPVPFGWVGKGWYSALYGIGLDALNVLLFVPFAIPIVGLLTGVKLRILLSVLLCLVLSLGIEVLQLAFHIGVFEIEDVICNMAGGLIGAMFGSLLKAREHCGDDPKRCKATSSR